MNCRAVFLLSLVLPVAPSLASGPAETGGWQRWAKDRRYPVLYLLDGRSHLAHTAGSVGYLAAQVDALRQLYAGYRFHDDFIDKGFPFAQQHFEGVSKTVGWPIPIPEGVVNNFGYAALSEGKTPEAIALLSEPRILLLDGPGVRRAPGAPRRVSRGALSQGPDRGRDRTRSVEIHDRGE